MLWENLNEFFGQLTTELQYSRCMALAQRQKHRSMEQSREPRDELTVTKSMTKEARMCNGEKMVSSLFNGEKTVSSKRQSLPSCWEN